MCAQSYLTLCDPVDCSPPGSSVHGQVFTGKNTVNLSGKHTDRCFYTRATWEAQNKITNSGGVSGKEIPLPMQKTQKMQVQSLDQEVLLEKGMATQSSIFAWRIPLTEEPGGL